MKSLFRSFCLLATCLTCMAGFRDPFAAIVNVKQLGAAGDGVHDDSGVISTALTSITNGSVLYFPAGTYYFGSSVTNSGKTNITLLGDGPGSTILLSKIGSIPSSADTLTNFVSYNCLTLSNYTGLVIQGMTLDGGVTGAGPSNIWYVLNGSWQDEQAILQVYNSTNVAINDVWGTKYHGSVPVVGSGGTPCPDVNYQGKNGPVYLNRCQFVKVVGGGLQVPTFNPEGWTAINCSDVDWSGWTFTRLPSDGFDDTLVGYGASSGLNIYGIESTNVWIHGNLITAHAGSAMNVSAPQGLVIEKNTIVGGTAPFGIFSGEGIDAGQENNQGVWTNFPIVRNLVIRDNVIRNVKGAAINVALNNSGKTNLLYQHPIISDNVIDGCYGGIIVDGIMDVAITGNTIRRAVQYTAAAWYGTAISMEDMSGGSVIGNLIDGSEQGLGTNLTAAAVFGIVGVGCDNMLIADNVVSNMTTANIYVAPFVDTQDSGHLILDNRCYNATNSLLEPYQIGRPGLRMGTVELRGNTYNGSNIFAYVGTYATNLVGSDLIAPTLIPYGPGPMQGSSTGLTYDDSIGSLWVKTNISAGQRVSIGANNHGLFTTTSHLDIYDPSSAQIFLEFSQTNFGNIFYNVNGMTLLTKENGVVYYNSLVIHTGEVAVIALKIKETAGGGKMGQTPALVGGTNVVSNTNVTANSRIFLQHATSTGTLGILAVTNIIAGTSFEVMSSSSADTNVINWLIIEPN